MFYKEIFITANFRRAADLALAVLAATWVALFFVTLFQDKPISRNWTNQGTTIDFTVLYIFEAAMEVAYDLAVLTFPLPMIRGLQMSTKRKWLLTGIFWLGGLLVALTLFLPRTLTYDALARLQLCNTLNCPIKLLR